MDDTKHSWLLYLGVASVFFALFLRDVGGVSLNKFLLLGLIGIFLLVLDYVQLVSFFCFLIPLLWGLPDTYVLLLVSFFLIIKSRGLSKKGLLLSGSFIALELLASIRYTDFDFTSFAGYASIIFILFILINDKSQLDFSLCLEVFTLGCVTLCMIIIISAIKNAPSDWMTLFANGWFRFGQSKDSSVSGMTLSVNANTMAYYSLMGISTGIVLIRNKANIKQGLFYGFMIILLAIAGFLTLSRSWFLILGLIIAVLLIFTVNTPKKFLVTISVLCIFFIGIFKYVELHPFLIQGLLTRFTSSSLDGAGGRTDILQQYLAAFGAQPKNWIFGTGVMDYQQILGVKSEFGMHNSLEQILVCYGIVGGTIFTWGLISPFQRQVKSNSRSRSSYIYWIPLIALIIFVQTIQFIDPSKLMLPFIIAVFSVQLGVATSFSSNNSSQNEIILGS